MKKWSSIIRPIRTIGWSIPLLLAFTGCPNGKDKQHVAGPAVVVTKVTAKDVPIYKEWIGTTDGFINADIHPKVNGYLKTKNYAEGSFVKEGQLLFTIDDRPYKAALDQAKGNLAQAQANFDKSELDVTRYTKLAKEGAVSQKELDDAIQQHKNDTANVQANQAAVETTKLNYDWTRLTSPISGLAGIAISQVGDLVDSNTKMTTVSQTNPIKVVFPISENELLSFQKWTSEKLKSGQVTKEELEKEDKDSLELYLNDGSKFPHRGTIRVADRQINIKTGTITLNGYFPNPDKMLRPGQFARVKALIYTMKSVVVVPLKAVLDIQGAEFVVVVGANNLAEYRPIKTLMATEDNQFRVVQGGLKVDETIIIDGLQKARPGTPVTPLTEEQAKAAAATHPAAGK